MPKFGFCISALGQQYYVVKKRKKKRQAKYYTLIRTLPNILQINPNRKEKVIHPDSSCQDPHHNGDQTYDLIKTLFALIPICELCEVVYTTVTTTADQTHCL